MKEEDTPTSYNMSKLIFKKGSWELLSQLRSEVLTIDAANVIVIVAVIVVVFVIIF